MCDVRKNMRRLGALRISKGAVVWIAAEKSKGRRLRASTRMFDNIPPLLA